MIIVKDILAVDLERFLTILYSKYVHSLSARAVLCPLLCLRRSYAPACLHTKEEWTSVLLLAHRWDSRTHLPRRVPLSASFWRVSMAIVLNGHSRLTSNSRHDADHA
jgi:hypothetical protein